MGPHFDVHAVLVSQQAELWLASDNLYTITSDAIAHDAFAMGGSATFSFWVDRFAARVAAFGFSIIVTDVAV